VRNDARPIGEDAPSSPVGGEELPAASQQSPDEREDQVVNRDDVRRVNRAAESKPAALPTDDSTLNTKI
jgi:hypothetical protein